MLPFEMPQEPYETETRPKHSPQGKKAPTGNRRGSTGGHGRQSQYRKVAARKPGDLKTPDSHWGFWMVFLITAGIPYAIFLLLALIGALLPR